MSDYRKQIGKVYRDVHGNVENLTVDNLGLIEITLAKMNQIMLEKKIDISEEESGQWIEVNYSNNNTVICNLIKCTDSNKMITSYTIESTDVSDIKSIQLRVMQICLIDDFLSRDKALETWLLLYSEATKSLLLEFEEKHKLMVSHLTRPSIRHKEQ